MPGNAQVAWRAIVGGISLLALGACGRPLLSYSDDVPGMVLRPVAAADVRDGRARFRQVLCAVNGVRGAVASNPRTCEKILHRLPDEKPGTGTAVVLGPLRAKLHLVVIPGIFGECVAHVARPFDDALERMRDIGATIEFVPVSGRSGSALNAAEIANRLASMQVGAGEKVVLIAYSKGASDALEALVAYPSVAAKVDALASVAGVVNGSPIADRLAPLYEGLLARLPAAECGPGDGLGVASLRRAERLKWLASHRLPERVRYYSVAGFDDSDGISTVLRPFWSKLGEIDPRNDGQIVFFDALIPGGTLLGYVRADHWAISLPLATAHPALDTALIDRNAFPREILLEAMVRFIAEDLAP